jgi:hypothetical protein
MAVLRWGLLYVSDERQSLIRPARVAETQGLVLDSCPQGPIAPRAKVRSPYFSSFSFSISSTTSPLLPSC